MKIFLLFGSETWVTTPCVIRTLGGFQYRVDHQITGKQTCNIPYSGWKYPPMRELMRESRMEEVSEYITQRQNTVVQYIETHTVMDICEEAER